MSHKQAMTKARVYQKYNRLMYNNAARHLDKLVMCSTLEYVKHTVPNETTNFTYPQYWRTKNQEPSPKQLRTVRTTRAKRQQMQRTTVLR